MEPQHLAIFLQQNFPGCDPQLERGAPGERIGGYLIWEGFDGMEQIDRQSKLREVLRQLPRDQQLQVTVILTVTPAEWTVMSEG
jgi:acid stress-induced BolA-like protein IbaG/YrbA